MALSQNDCLICYRAHLDLQEKGYPRGGCAGGTHPSDTQRPPEIQLSGCGLDLQLEA